MIKIDNYKAISIKCYKILFDLENQLRSVILSELSSRNNNWWSEIKTKPFVKDIDEKIGYYSNLKKDITSELKKDKEFLGSDQFLMHEIYYTSMQDLYTIIEFFWQEHFKKIFKGRKSTEFFFHSFNYVRYIRNKVMHSKPITEQEFDTVKSFFENIKKDIDASRLKIVKFDRCVYLGDILNKFENEIGSHDEKFQINNYSSRFHNNVYNLLNSEWWWKSDQFTLGKRLSKYYAIISQMNKKIVDPRLDSIGVMKFAIKDNYNIKENCQMVFIMGKELILGLMEENMRAVLKTVKSMVKGLGVQIMENIL